MSFAEARRALVALTVVVVVGALAPSALAGQIVYTHGGDLWAMSDAGGGAHPLVTATEVGGDIGYDSDFPNYTGLSIQPNGNGIAFDANVPPSGCASTCYAELDPGLYSLVDGKVTRLSAAPTACPGEYEPPAGDCESSDTDPAVTSSGQVVYLSQGAFATPGCLESPYCSATIDSTILSEPLTGGTPTDWPMPSSTTCSKTPSVCPQFPLQGAIASDPANSAEIAYSGSQTGAPQACGASQNAACTPIDVENTSATVNQPSLDDSAQYDGLSFSQDGTELADIETGDSPGIWVYPSGQSYTSGEFHYALADTGTGSDAISSIAFVGNGAIVFSADNNLYEIQSSCWTSASDTAPGCTFNPADPTSGGIKQLTSDGTAGAPDGEPAWTDSGTTIYGPADPPSCGCSTPPPPTTTTTKLKVSLSTSTGQKVVKQKALVVTVKCNLVCRVGVAGGLQVKGSRKVLLTKAFSGSLTANRARTVTLKLSSKQLSTIKKALKSHKKVSAAVEVVGESGSQTAKTTKTFTVRH